MADKCNHRFQYDEQIHRWVCVKCDRKAPKCFNPKPEAIHNG